MKLTEEQEKQIQNRLDKTPYYGHCTEEYMEGIEDGAKWAIEKFGGIRWNKHPENRPTKVGYYAVYSTSFELWKKAYWNGGWTIRFGESGLTDIPDVTHWAQINLPNQ